MKKSEQFYSSREWLKLRYEALRKAKRRCMLCGAHKLEIHVDHIKPRSKYPELALEISNLQLLCKWCNFGKSNTDETDFRNRYQALRFVRERNDWDYDRKARDVDESIK